MWPVSSQAITDEPSRTSTANPTRRAGAIFPRILVSFRSPESWHLICHVNTHQPDIQFPENEQVSSENVSSHHIQKPAWNNLRRCVRSPRLELSTDQR